MIAAIVVAVLMLGGVGVRCAVAAFERSRIPASVVAGLIGCIIAQGLILSASPLADEVSTITSTFRGWAPILISLVFAGLLLAPSDRSSHRTRDVWQQGVVAWIIILGQIALGLFATALLVSPFYDVPLPFGQFIEVTMAGGFGSANSMATLLEGDPYRFPYARDALVFGATAALLWGVVSGLALARIGQKRGWTAAAVDDDSVGADEATLKREDEARDRGQDPLVLQLCFLLVALGMGLLFQWSISTFSVQMDEHFDPMLRRISKNLGNLPLFFFALLGGWILRLMLEAMSLGWLLHRQSLQRLAGLVMDVLITTSLAAIAFDAIRAYVVPVMLLLAIGSVWSIWCLVWLSPRLLPNKYWFELGLINYGFSTAATAQGMMLLKMVDPRLRSGAAQTYALAAPLTAPFIGGGVITFAVLPWVIEWTGLVPVGIVTAVIAAGLIWLGRRLRI